MNTYFLPEGTKLISETEKLALREISGIEHQNPLIYGLKFLKNWLLERLASNFPIPSWRVHFHRMRGINIGKNVYIGYDVIFDRIHPECITISDYAEIGDRCIISAHQRGNSLLRDLYPRTVKPVKIERGVNIFPGSIIIQGVVIGEMAVVGTGSVVLWDVPPRSVVAGNPAKVIKKLDHSKVSEEVLI